LSEKFGAGLPDILEEVSKQITTKDIEAVRRRYEQLEEDIKNIEAGRVPLPNYTDSANTTTSGSRKGGKGGSGKRDQHSERKKGIPWTEEEHRLFLLGLEKFGKGDWRSISRNFVVSRTPTQVASHAQKYFIRLSSMNKRDKRRASIHDITSVDRSEVPSLTHRVGQQQAAQNGHQAAANGANGGPQGAPVAGGQPAPVNGMPAAVNGAAAQGHPANGQKAAIYGSGMVSMPPPSYVSNMSLPPQSGQQYV